MPPIRSTSRTATKRTASRCIGARLLAVGVIDEMVGEVDRILQYPARGFHLPHEIPASVLESWKILISLGITRHLLPRLDR